MLLAFQYSFAFAAPLPTPLLLLLPQSQVSLRGALLLLYDHEDPERILRRDPYKIQCNGSRSTDADCKPKPFSKVPGGRFELPTNRESFRGCSTVANSKWRGRDSSCVSVLVRFAAPIPTSLLLFCHNGKFRAETLCRRCVTAEMLREAGAQINTRANVMATT
jgi:hypothetical protein